MTCQRDKPSTAIAHVVCESKLRSVVRSSTHPCPGKWLAIGRAVVYYARASHTFSAGMNCRHCRLRCFGGTFSETSFAALEHDGFTIHYRRTGRLDACQYLVIHTLVDKMLNKDKHLNDPRCLRKKATFSLRSFMQPCPGN